jgi:predicted Co/Zn/Cd cation transporter (cation efflux family)
MYPGVWVKQQAFVGRNADGHELRRRMCKVGRIFYVMVHPMVPETHAFERIADLDQVRARMR